MEEVKNWWESKTIWGSLISMISMVLYGFGIIPMMFTGDDIINMANAAIVISGGFGSILAIYGRITATKTIGTTNS
jgi:hypothetical protein